MSSHSNAHSSVVELISFIRFMVEMLSCYINLQYPTLTMPSVILILDAMIIGFEQIKKGRKLQ